MRPYKKRTQPTRNDDPPLYPAFLNLRGVPVLVVGGGAVALRKTRDLLSAKADVVLVAPECVPPLLRLAKRVKIVARRFRPSDLKGKRLVFAATNDSELNRKICAAAQRRGIFSNCASPPAAGDVMLAASLRYGHLCISFSTGGASPGLSAALKDELAKVIGPEWGKLVALLRKKRAEVLKRLPNADVRRALLLKLSDPVWAARVRRLGATEVGRRMEEMIRVAELPG